MEKVLARNFEEHCSANTTPTHIPGDLEIFFSAGPEPISLSKYIERLVEYTQCSESVFVVALIYLHRARAVRRELALTYENSFRLFCASLYVASKHTDDIVYDGDHYAAVFGIELEELLELEARLLRVLKWDLFVTDEAYANFDKQLKSSLGTVRTLSKSAVGLKCTQDGGIYVERNFSKGVAARALITIGLAIFSVALPLEKSGSVQYARLNFPGIYLPRDDIGIQRDDGVRFPGRSGRLGSSDVFALTKSFRVDQTRERNSKDWISERLSDGSTLGFQISENSDNFEVLFKYIRSDHHRTDESHRKQFDGTRVAVVDNIPDPFIVIDCFVKGINQA